MTPSCALSPYLSCLWAPLVLLSCKDKDDGIPSDTSVGDTADSAHLDTEDSGLDTDDTGEWINPCTEGTIHIDDDPTAYPSIQSAIHVLQEGSVLHICPGTHYESLSLTDSNGIVIPWKIYITGNSAEDTIIDAQGIGPAMFIPYSSVEISNLTLTGGSGYAFNFGDGEYDPRWITFGGGVYIIGSANVVIEHVIIESNTADIGGGIFVETGGEFYDFYPNLLMNECTVRNNLADGDDYGEFNPPYGGGIVLSGFSYLFESYNTDWGEGKDDNESGDLLYTTSSKTVGALDIPPGSSLICDTRGTGDVCQFLE